VTGYYDGPDLTATVVDALEAAGRPGEVDRDDLAALPRAGFRGERRGATNTSTRC
jgi:hypothetical protein